MARKTFDDIVLFARTGLNPRQNFKLGRGENKYITIKNIHNNTLAIDENTDVVDDDAIALIHRRSQIKKGDVLFCSIGRLGDMYIITDEPKGWDINESVFAFTLNTEIIRQKYFYYLFKNHTTIEYLTKNSSGSTFKSIKMRQLKQMTFDLPLLDEQDLMVKVLDGVSKIILLRQKQLTELDKLAKSRFVELFGDPVSNPYKWEKVPLSELADIKIGPFGSLLHKCDYVKGGHPLVNPSHIKDGKIVTDSKLTICEKKFGEMTAYHLKIGDVVMGRRGEMGRCAIVTEDGLLCGTGSLLIRSKGEITADYIQKIISFPSFKKMIEDMAVGQTMLNLNVPIVSNFKIIKPPLDVQHSYYSFIRDIDKSKLIVQKSLEKLEMLQDALMQQYFG